MKKLIFIFSILACMSADCHKKKDNPTYFMPQEFKDYVVFPQGSYWIYEDSISGITDSMYLQMQTTKIMEPPGYNDWGYNYEYIEEQLYSSYKNQINSRVSRYNEFISNNENGSYMYYGLYPLFISNISIGIGCDNLKYIQFLDSLLIKNIWLKNIKVFSNIDPIGNIKSIKTFFCRNIGLVKMEINDNTDTTGLKIWELKKYHIN